MTEEFQNILPCPTCGKGFDADKKDNRHEETVCEDYNENESRCITIVEYYECEHCRNLCTMEQILAYIWRQVLGKNNAKSL